MTDETTILDLNSTENNEAEAENKLEETDLDADLESDEDDETLEDDSEADDSEDEDGDDEEEEGEEESEPETIDVEYEGKNYKVPPELKEALLRQGDYTRKTQEVAEQRKSIEVEREQVQQMAQITQEEISHVADLRAIDGQLQQYQNVNWQQLEAEDPLAAQSHWRQYQLLKDQRTEAAQKLEGVSKQRSEQAEQMTLQRLQKTADFAQKNIPNWSKELDDKVTQFALDQGFTIEALKTAYTPEVYSMLWKAYVGDQYLKNQSGAKSRPKGQAEKKPLSKVKQSSAPAGKKPIGEMSMEEYARYRNKQEKARAVRSR